MVGVRVERTGVKICLEVVVVGGECGEQGGDVVGPGVVDLHGRAAAQVKVLESNLDAVLASSGHVVADLLQVGLKAGGAQAARSVQLVQAGALVCVGVCVRAEVALEVRARLVGGSGVWAAIADEAAVNDRLVSEVGEQLALAYLGVCRLGVQLERD
ncbi:hypothetical protein BpHYR1_013865 [Brachionus plicatilis]|uniref:Uncharacterized protein n=1 Tax=Brachionus plicatilis TaxID=10195 RepID=A0A3M7SAF1_BRAPC|nr:hypothetical protein BpHYR1_013865 [Brachionus plicatilis]